MRKLFSPLALLLLLAPMASFAASPEGAAPLPPELFGTPLQQETLVSQDPDRPVFAWSGVQEITQEQWLKANAFNPAARPYYCRESCFLCGQCPPGDNICAPNCL